MKLICSILLAWWGTANAEVVPVRSAKMQQGIATKGHIHALTIFARFQDEGALAGAAVPSFAADLFDERLPGSISHFYNEMSRGQFALSGEVLPLWYAAENSTGDYREPNGDFGDFAREVIEAVDADRDLGLYDNDGPDGFPNSGDDDGYVDFLFIVTRSAPLGFIIDAATGIARLGLGQDYRSNDLALGGGRIRIRADGSDRGVGGAVQQGRNFEEAVGSMAHEFAHFLLLPDLYDLSDLSSDIGPEEDSAGVGYWDIMAHGNRGWDERGGPNPFSAWSLGQLGWLGVENDQLEIVEDNLSDVLFEDVNAGGKVYLLPDAETSSYYLVEFRRRGTSYYERNLPGEGLLIWHVNPRMKSNDEEMEKLVDLVCADGQYADAGFPLGEVPAPFSGRDNLDFWAGDEAYRMSQGGNLGDATDMWDGIRYRDFWAASNPAAGVGISVENIRSSGESMVADLKVKDHRRAGPIARSQSWADSIKLVGDISVLPGVRLEVASGTRVEIGADFVGGGNDPERVELQVLGQLVSNATGRGRVLFTSAAAEPTPGDWAGISMQASASAFFRRTDIEYAENGIVAEGLTLSAADAAQDARVLQVEEVQLRHLRGDGIRLLNIADPLRFTGLEVRDIGGVGLRVEGPGLTRVSGAVFVNNAGGGLVRQGGFIELLQSHFESNGLGAEDRANLLLGRQVFGLVEGNSFSGGSIGVRCVETKEVVIANNTFRAHQVGLLTRSARARIFSNQFNDNDLALRVEGVAVPTRLDLNVIQGDQQLLINDSEREVMATNNWWGRDDEAWIAARISGAVEWRPFLNFDPRVPLDFALRQNYPNPFNASTTIEYQIGINDPIIAGHTGVVLEIRSMVGLLVRRLVDQPASPGFYSVVWDGRNDAGDSAASGVYYYQLDIGPIAQYRKLLFLK
ncbi:MAG: immune inhibitor A domain-containing protein [Candidatus Latescibacterota bacterium]|jgi:M6 family metalloprotease-like protein